MSGSWDMNRWLAGAKGVRSDTDPDQGLVYLQLESGVALFGYVMNVTPYLISIAAVTEKRAHNGKWSATTHNYEIQISARHIILARYADLSDTDITEKGSWT